MATEQVNVRFTADTREYVTGQERAEAATDDLTQSIRETKVAQDDLSTSSATATTATDGLNSSFKSTAGGAIDAKLGVSGFGDALIETGRSALTAAKSMSTLNKAMLLTIGGALIAGLIALAVYWDDIAEAIGLTNIELDKFLEKSSEVNTGLVQSGQESLSVLQALGLSQKKILEANLELLTQQNDILSENDKELEARLALRLEELEIIAKVSDPTGRLGRLDALKKENKEYQDISNAIDANTIKLQEQTRLIFIATKEVENYREAIVSTKDAAVTLADVQGFMLVGLGDLAEGVDAYAKEWDDAAAAINKAYQEQLKLDATPIEEIASVWDSVSTAVQGVGIAIGQVFRLSAALAEDDKEAKAKALRGEAVANAAVAGLAVAKQFPPPNPLFFVGIAGVATLLATSITQINSALESSGSGSISSTGATGGTTRTTFETSLPDNIRPDFVPVLVTEDFNRVNDRVKVTDSRGSLS